MLNVLNSVAYREMYFFFIYLILYFILRANKKTFNTFWANK